GSGAGAWASAAGGGCSAAAADGVVTWTARQLASTEAMPRASIPSRRRRSSCGCTQVTLAPRRRGIHDLRHRPPSPTRRIVLGRAARAASPSLRTNGSQLGIRTRLHSMRHYSATELLASGVDLRTVAGRLGHGPGGAITLRVYAAWMRRPIRT